MYNIHERCLFFSFPLEMCFIPFTALQPKDVEQFFKPVFEQAKEFDMMYKKCRPAQHKELHVPYVIVSFRYFCCVTTKPHQDTDTDTVIANLFFRSIWMRSTLLVVWDFSRR